MNRSLLTAFLVVMSMTGCVVYDRDRGNDGSGGGTSRPLNPGDLTVSWSFSGATCNDVPNVKSVKITIPGEDLQNGGVYPCLVADYPGVELHDFAGGAYTFTIEALGYSNERLYAGSGTFTVDGDARVSVDLTPSGSPTSYAYLSWKFPANSQFQNPTCAQAGITYVDVQIDDLPVERLACVDGQALPGVTTPYLYPGTHDIVMKAVNSTGYAYYEYYGTLQTFGGNPVSAEYSLAWAVGGAVVRWSLTNGSVTQTCAQAGVDSVRINFRDEAGNLLYGNGGDGPHPCNSLFVAYDYLKPGNYRVFVQATGPGGTFYLSNADNPPMLTVRAAEWPPESAATNVTVYRQ